MCRWARPTVRLIRAAFRSGLGEAGHVESRIKKLLEEP
jgi:hypothetical protein